jgi:hypothetical protein
MTITLKQAVEELSEINKNDYYNIYFKSHFDGIHVIIEENKFTITSLGGNHSHS